jgi:hypothetical protein
VEILSQVEAEDLKVSSHTLQQNITKRTGAKRFKKRRTKAISAKNKRARVQYGKNLRKRNITDFW